MTVWTTKSDAARTHPHKGKTYRNYPLPYWVQYVRRFGASDSSLVIVQNQCETREQESRQLPVDDKLLEGFAYQNDVAYSALTNRGRASLDEALCEAAAKIDKPLIGKGRADVKHHLEKLYKADQKLDAANRQYRTLSREQFKQFCEDHGDISDPALFLKFLHNVGTTFYDENLFGETIILDQTWALDAIYALFERDKVYRHLLHYGGRFTRADLGRWIWDEANHTEEAQNLFISMMQSCGICFQIREEDKDKKVEAEYLAPDLLPEDPLEDELAMRWSATGDVQDIKLEFDLLPSALMRSIIAKYGKEAGRAGLYWKNGLCLYDKTKDSRLLISQDINEESWDGTIHIQTRQGQVSEMLNQATEAVLNIARRLNLSPNNEDEAKAALKTALAPDHTEEKEVKAEYSDEDITPRTGYYVSYAWKDDDSEFGKKREDKVDQLCVDAQVKNITIIRDKTHVGYGDNISNFMKEIGEGKRVYIFLSKKYLESYFCMFELYELWRNARFNDEEFISRIRIYKTEDVDLDDLDYRWDRADFWQERFEKREARIMKRGTRNLGEKGGAQHYREGKFCDHIADILEAIANHVQARNFEEFKGFED